MVVGLVEGSCQKILDTPARTGPSGATHVTSTLGAGSLKFGPRGNLSAALFGKLLGAPPVQLSTLGRNCVSLAACQWLKIRL